MSIQNRIFHLLDALDVDQKEFANAIGVTSQVVSKWKTGALKSYTKYLGEIVRYFGIVPDYFLEQGVFKNWDSIMKYPISVFQEIMIQVPDGTIEYGENKGTSLRGWLDIRMCYGITGQHEIDLIQWFYRTIAKVEIKKTDNIPELYSPAKVTITFIDQGKKEVPTAMSSDGPSESELVFKSLSPAKQEEALRYMRYLVEQEDK